MEAKEANGEKCRIKDWKYSLITVLFIDVMLSFYDNGCSVDVT